MQNHFYQISFQESLLFLNLQNTIMDHIEPAIGECQINGQRMNIIYILNQRISLSPREDDILFQFPIHQFVHSITEIEFTFVSIIFFFLILAVSLLGFPSDAKHKHVNMSQLTQIVKTFISSLPNTHNTMYKLQSKCIHIKTIFYELS